MKSSCQKEPTDNKKRYVFFSDPDVIAKRAESSAITAQIRRDSEAQQQVPERLSANLPIPTLDIKSLENLLSYHPVQSYPFTFISAVKQKLALGNHSNLRNTRDSSYQPRNLTSSILKTNSAQNLYQVIRKMDFVRPLKVPDLKVSPKTLNFPCRENSVSKNPPSTKSEIATKELAHDRFDKTVKISERVQRKLDFSSSDGTSSSVINCESIEPLKAPNVSIASNFSKKKEHARDVSREKENRSKRLKREKEDILCAKKDELQDQAKRSKSPRHVSRRDAADSTCGATMTRLKSDRLSFHVTKTNDPLSTKSSKMKNPVTSTVKKDNSKRQKSFNVQSVESAREVPLESKSRTCGNKTLDFPSGKLPDSTTMRDGGNITVLSSSSEGKSKDICHTHFRPIVSYKEQSKRVSDKSKISSNKIEGKVLGASSVSEAEDIASETNSSKNRQQPKSKDTETTMENTNSVRSAKTSESFKYTEQSASTSTKKDDESYSQSVVTITKTTTDDDDTNDVDVGAVPEALFDPRRISFRDSSYSQQEEFHNLTTPDKMDLVIKSKQRRYLMQNSDSEADARCPKYKPTAKSDKEEEKIKLMHPTALHMQFQAELHLLDSFNESLRHVMDVEKCLYNIKREQESKNPEEENEDDKEVQVNEGPAATVTDSDVTDVKIRRPFDYVKKDIVKMRKSNICEETHFAREYHVTNQGNIDESGENPGKLHKTTVKVAEVQTQTVNDMATQTDAYMDKRNMQSALSEIHGSTYGRSFVRKNEVPQISLDSVEQFENLDQIDEMSLPRIGTMSEISLHETTSSIRTETGTEISISTRDITFKSRDFSKYLNLEIDKLLQDEDKRYDKYEMMFKCREKTLNDKTRKLAKLQEQKRAWRDKGEESRVSSLKKKQRAVLLKIEQERDEIHRLKELHHVTSQERKNILQKQKDMLNYQMSTKDILTKLKRSADSQSPRRLSGPMKVYDILSNSSISSLVDSDKSHHDRFQVDAQAAESDVHSSKLGLVKTDKSVNLTEESNVSVTRFDELAESNEIQEQSSPKSQKSDLPKYELKSRRYEEKMPKAHVLRLKQNQLDMESKRIESHPMKIKRFMENQKSIEEESQSSRPQLDASERKDRSDFETLREKEELSKRLRTSPTVDSPTVSRDQELVPNIVTANSKCIEKDINAKAQDVISKTTKSLQVSEAILRTSINKNSKKTDKLIMSDRDVIKKLQHTTHSAELRTGSKRKSSKYQKTKSSDTLEDVLRPKSNAHIADDFTKHKQTRIENELLPSDNNNENSVLGELDLNESQSSLQALIKDSKFLKNKSSKLLSEIINDHESKENISDQFSSRKLENDEDLSRNERAAQDLSTSKISAFAVARHSSEESERNFSKSIVVRSQDKDFKASKKLEQILTARETALASRKNCVDQWMAWHTRLKAEEDRVIRMEQAAIKLVAATSSVLSQDTTVSSDTSDVEGRIEILTKKLAERRVELSRLKREARKQTKQKLRALEANLLNQLKKYDMTINEMRKKLDSKRTVRSNDKLAIESKSLADFIVPEIPLKRIQDLYKSSDLLRSRSESDLPTRNQLLDLPKVAIPATYFNDKHERNDSQRSTKSVDTKRTSISELKNAVDINHSARSTFEECTSTEERDKLGTVTPTSSSGGGKRVERYVTSTSDTNEGQQLGEFEMRRDSDTEDVRTIIDTVRSGSEVQTVSDARSSEDRDTTINTDLVDDKSVTCASVDHSRSVTASTAQSDILEETASVDCTKQSVPSRSDYTTKSAAAACVTVDASNPNVPSFSKKLDFLQVNTRNLNEDISFLETGVKVLSEMVSRFSEKVSEKPEKVGNDERSTSQDISEIISEPFLDTNIDKEEKRTILSDREINTESLVTSTNNRKSKSSNYSSRDKYAPDRVNSAISVISEEALTIPDSIHEIDYEAKSKEIMNKIETSIISEYTKVARGDYNVSTVLENDMQNLHRGNDELSNDLATLELDIKSISEIFSKTSDSGNSLDLATSTATQIITDAKKDTTNDLNETKCEENKLAEEQTSATHSSKLSDRSSAKSIYSPIIAGHRSKEMRKMNSQGTLLSADDSISSRTSRVLAGENLKSPESISQVPKVESNIVNKAKISRNLERDEDIRATLFDDTVNSAAVNSTADRDQSHAISAEDVSVDKDNWTTSDSFQVPQSEISTGERAENSEEHSYSDRTDNTSNDFSKGKVVSYVDNTDGRETGANFISDVDVSTFVPKGESTKVKAPDVTLADAIVDSRVTPSRYELDDILDVIAKEDDQEDDQEEEENVSNSESEQFDNMIADSMTNLLDQVESIVKKDGGNVDRRNSCDHEINVSLDDRGKDAWDPETRDKINVEEDNNREETMVTSLHETKADASVNLRDNEDSPRKTVSQTREIIITELDSDSMEEQILSELEIDAKIELAEEEEFMIDEKRNDDRLAREDKGTIQIQECLESILEQDSSDGEQLDNLVEVAESGLDTVEKLIMPSRASPKPMMQDGEVSMQAEEGKTNYANASRDKTGDESARVAPRADNLNKTFDIQKDPDYEDISEESLEVSEILDKNELPSTMTAAKKSIGLSENYQATQKSEEVLRILDEIARKSSSDSTSDSQRKEMEARSATEKISELLGADFSPIEMNDRTTKDDGIADEFYKTEDNELGDQFLEGTTLSDKRSAEVTSDIEDLVGRKSDEISEKLEEMRRPSQIIYELRERVSQMQEQDGSSESSEAGDTPRGVSEIEMDSPRDFSDSRLDIDILDDDLLSGTKEASQNVDVKTNFHPASIVATPEKDIEAMIDKLKASLEQPGLEVAELEAKLLRIEQLQIELEIKKLEAEEVSYYVREIPNKPPPPYTPPGEGRLSLGSLSLTAVIPSNVDELTSFTEKATSLIYDAKLAGEDVESLETPAEIYESIKEKNENVRRDRRIYNTFLFDLCKETVAEAYRTEYEKPGPSWTKPNVKTKPTMKIPRSVEELTEYVNKEVATLFGFKTKLQRENMVMRWSRKRRDRVDELLAREAQAEEDEWTKFHHDELAVKNGLTVAILDSLVMETVNMVKVTYGKKRRMMV